MAEHMVQCKKLSALLPGLSKAPFPGQIGKLIYDNISEQAWREWRDDMQIKVLNEYRLNMGNPQDHQVMIDQMLLFLNLKQGQAAEVGSETRGRQES